MDNQDFFVTFTTTMGSFKVKLFKKDTPRTVSNFYQLATSGLYNGVIFHRVIEDFMIQGGDPEGTGMGGPGYRFKDEFVPHLKHDKPGILSMANAGPNTNGSQFFITVVPTSWLNGRHTVFGEVVSGMDVVLRIAKVNVDSSDRPLEDIVIEKLDFEGEFQPVDIQKV